MNRHFDIDIESTVRFWIVMVTGMLLLTFLSLWFTGLLKYGGVGSSYELAVARGMG
jgi:hypothetical protein